MKEINQKEFRKELLKTMPGYSWAIHKSYDPRNYLYATGTQSSGFNRTSTMYVLVRRNHDEIEYETEISGYGTRAVREEPSKGPTLSIAFRGLQDYLGKRAAHYEHLHTSLVHGRNKL